MKTIVISDHPHNRPTVEGYLARVNEIDKCLVDNERIYLSISYKKNFQKIKTTLDRRTSILELNCFLHCIYILWLCFFSRFIVVHSVHNLKKAPASLLFARKMIVDLHGLVSEEMPRSKWLYKALERFVWRHAFCVISVTHAMNGYFENAHGGRKKKSIVLPIFGHSVFHKSELDREFDFVYAGGVQEWQCIGQLVDAVKSYSSARVLILTPEIGYFNDLFANESHRVSVKYCSGPDYYEMLRRARFGFMLREDIPLNNVACPTKLIDYLSCGVVPILASDKVGDFVRFGMNFVSLGEFVGPNHLSKKELASFRKNNYAVVHGLGDLSKEGLENLTKILT